MANKEFNLSALENGTTFDTPLKECFDYEAILGLIKEEVDIEPTEDESDYQKIERISSPIKGARRKRTFTCEGVFKSPYKKKYCLKLRSPDASSSASKEKPIESDWKSRSEKRGRTLGTLKPRRSSLANQRRYRTSVSHSEASTFSDFGEENVAEGTKRILKNSHPQPILQQNGIEYKHVSSISEPTVDSSNADDEISVSSKGESTSLATTDPLDVETANDSYVESSQSTQTSSELRQRLNQRRSTIDIKTPISDIMKEVLPNGIIKSEDENENFSLTLSPSSKASGSTIKKEASVSPGLATNRKSICRVSPLKNVTQEHENSGRKDALRASTLRQRRRKVSVGSPLKGLTQELENCIRNGDYVEMCDSETESISFTFETIQLLNDYEEYNQQANNKIFDKILSSPTRSPNEETPAIADELVTPKKEQLIQDPLHIDYLPPSTSKKRGSAKRKSARSKINEINEDPLHIDEKDPIKDVPSLKKRTKGKKKGSGEREQDQKSLHLTIKNVSAASTTKKPPKEKKKGSGESKGDQESLHIDAEKNCSSKSSEKNRSKGDQKGSTESELDDESLHIEDSDSMEDDSFKSTEKKSKAGQRNLPVRKCRERDKTESSRGELDESFPDIEDSDAAPDFSPASRKRPKKTKTAKRTSFVEETRKREKKNDCEAETSQNLMSMDEDDAIKDIPSTSTPKKRSKGEEKVSSESELHEESLHIEDSDTMEDVSSESAGKKSEKKLSALRKSQEIEEPETSQVDFEESFLYTENADTTGHFSSTFSPKEKNVKTTAKRRSSARNTKKREDEDFGEFENCEISMTIGDSLAISHDFSTASELETSSEEMDLDLDEEFTPVAKSISNRKRFSGRTKTRESVNMNLSDCENDERLTMKAVKLAEKIAAAKKKNAVPEEVYKKMLDLFIELRHEPPPQHDIKDGLSVLTVQEEKLFLTYAPLNKGKYSTAEDEIIKQNWNDFCQDHDWDPENYKPFLSLKHGKKLIMSCSEERKKFVQFLANGLPNRPLFSVYKRFRRLFDKRYNLYKRYKAREDANIIAYTTCQSLELKDKRFVELSQIMRRSNESLWKRNKMLQDHANKELTKVEWNLPLVEKFITTLLDVTISDELIDLKDAFLPRFVWQTMEKKMEIKWNILQKFWEQKLHVQLFAPEPILMNEIKIKLIEYMHMKKVSNSRDIRWDDLARHFDGYTIPFLRYIFNMLIIEISRKLKARGFRAMVKFLHSTKIDYLLKKPKDKCLPRISYKNKKVELVAEDVEETDETNEEKTPNEIELQPEKL